MHHRRNTSINPTNNITSAVIIFILDQTKTGVRHQLGHGQFPPTTYLIYFKFIRPMNWPDCYDQATIQTIVPPSEQIPWNHCHQAHDLASRPLDPDVTSLTDKTSMSKSQTSITWPHRPRGSIDLSTLQISPAVIRHATKLFRWQETIHHNIAGKTKTRSMPQYQMMTWPWGSLKAATNSMGDKQDDNTRANTQPRSPRPRWTAKAKAPRMPLHGRYYG